LKINLISAIIKKEILQILRDPSSIIIAFILPLILMFVFGYGVNLDSNRLKVGLVKEISNVSVNSLAYSYDISHYFDMNTHTSRRPFISAILVNQIRGMIVIPERFENNLLYNNHAHLQVLADGSEPNIASFLQNYSVGLLTVWLNQREHMQGQTSISNIHVNPRYWYNAELKSRNFLVPGAIAIVMAMIGTLLTSLVIAREWERGTMEALLATPVSIIDIIIGKLIPYFILGMGSMLVCAAIAVFLYHVPFRGTIIALTLSSSVFLFAALSQGLLISSVAKDQFLASQIALISAFLPAFILSGFVFEIGSMPYLIRLLTRIFPARYFVSILQTVFLVGDVWILFIKSMFAMLVISLLLIAITQNKFHKWLDR
jgi:ABC-2 type transport system permease protein